MTLKKLNIGCGNIHKNGFVNIDIIEPADLICDVSKGLPFEDNSVEKIEMDNLLEHFDNDQFLFVMNECHRVLIEGGVFWFRVPDALNWADGAFGDPTHKRFFVPRSFNYILVDKPQWINYGKYYGFKGWNGLVKTDGKFFEGQLTPVK